MSWWLMVDSWWSRKKQLTKKGTVPFLLAGVLMSLPHLYAKSAGTTSAGFLEIEPDAEANGLAGAYVSRVENGSSLYWNPAGLGYMERMELGLTHMLYMEDLNYSFITFTEPMRNFGVLSIGAIGLLSGAIPKTTENLSGNYIDSGETFNSTDITILLGWGKRLNREMSLGFGIKSIRQTIDDSKASGIAGDIGVKYLVSERVRTGLSFQNIGTKIKGNDLPRNIRIGLDYKLKDDKTNAGIEMDFPSSSESNYRIGIEHWLSKGFSLRAGYITGAEIDGMTGIQAGIGLKSRSMEFGYAYLPYGDLGTTHQVSLYTRFGEPKKMKTRFKTGEHVSKDKRQNVAVANFEAAAPLSESEASFITDFFRTALLNAGVFNLVERSRMDVILSEQGFQQTGCTTQECAVQMGKILNVQYMIMGRCGKLQSRFITTVNIIKVETGEVVYSDKEDCYSEQEMEIMVQKLVDRIRQYIRY